MRSIRWDEKVKFIKHRPPYDGIALEMGVGMNRRQKPRHSVIMQGQNMPDKLAYEKLIQRAEDLEKQLAQKNKTLERLTRFVSLFDGLNTGTPGIPLEIGKIHFFLLEASLI